MAEKKNKQLLEKNISYWTKHQELDKFNYNITINQINNQIIFFGAFFIPLMLSGISLIINKNYYLLDSNRSIDEIYIETEQIIKDKGII